METLYFIGSTIALILLGFIAGYFTFKRIHIQPIVRIRAGQMKGKGGSLFEANGDVKLIVEVDEISWTDYNLTDSISKTEIQ